MRRPIRPSFEQLYFAAITWLGLGLVAWVLTLSSTPLAVGRMTQIAAYSVAFAGLSLLTHRLGLLSLGHAAIVGAGAVVAAHLVNDLNLPLVLIPAVGFGAGLVIGLALGLVVSAGGRWRPKIFLLIVSAVMAAAYPLVVRALDGSEPVRLEGEFVPPEWSRIAAADQHVWVLALVAAVAVVAFVLVARLTRGTIGRAMVATSKPKVAAAFGVRVYRLRLSSIAASGALAGAGGGLVLMAQKFTDADQYPPETSLKMVTLVLAITALARASSALTRSLSYVAAAGVLVLLPVWIADRPQWQDLTGTDALVRSEGFIYVALALIGLLVALPGPTAKSRAARLAKRARRR